MADPQARLQAYFCDLVFESLLYVAHCRIEQIDSDKSRYVVVVTKLDPNGSAIFRHPQIPVIIPLRPSQMSRAVAESAVPVREDFQHISGSAAACGAANGSRRRVLAHIEDVMAVDGFGEADRQTNVK